MSMTNQEIIAKLDNLRNAIGQEIIDPLWERDIDAIIDEMRQRTPELRAAAVLTAPAASPLTHDKHH